MLIFLFDKILGHFSSAYLDKVLKQFNNGFDYPKLVRHIMDIE